MHLVKPDVFRCVFERLRRFLYVEQEKLLKASIILLYREALNNFNTNYCRRSLFVIFGNLFRAIQCAFYENHIYKSIMAISTIEATLRFAKLNNISVVCKLSYCCAVKPKPGKHCAATKSSKFAPDPFSVRNIAQIRSLLKVARSYNNQSDRTFEKLFIVKQYL